MRPIEDEGGRSMGMMVISRDNTARKRVEEERDRLRALLQLYVERLPLAYIVCDTGGVVIDWNSMAERLFGYSKAEILGTRPPYERLVPAAARSEVEKLIERLRAGDMAAHSIIDTCTRDGRTITCEWFNTPLLDAEGRFAGFVSLAQDISHRRAAEQALQRSEERFRQIAESISEVFWLTSVDKETIEYVSPAYEMIWGRGRRHISEDPQAWLDAVHPEDRERIREAARRDRNRGTYDEEYRIVRPDGTERWIRDRRFPVRDAEGAVVRVAGVAEDITARRQLEAQLQQAQKMEAIGQLAGGVAHDFNNLLTVITGYSELLLDEVTEPAQRALVEDILRTGERSAALTRQLLAFSRQQLLAPRTLDLNAVVVDMEKMLRRLIGENIALRTRLHHPLPPIKADQAQLEQVLLNLAVNARDAMPAGGDLILQTGVCESQVIFEVADTGAGMPEAVRRRAFEPFFTTKGVGRGTGLGLAVVHGFVAQSQGRIEVESEVGRGTTFRIFLPSAERGDAASTGSPAEADRSARSETILVVEDDEAVRVLTRRMLERCGYHVLVGEDAGAAMRIAREHPGPIHLLVTDVVMPGLAGCALAEQLVAARSEMKLLYVSGHTDDVVLQRGVLTNTANFLQKPFSPAALAEKVRAVLNDVGTPPG